MGHRLYIFFLTGSCDVDAAGLRTASDSTDHLFSQYTKYNTEPANTF